MITAIPALSLEAQRLHNELFVGKRDSNSYDPIVQYNYFCDYIPALKKEKGVKYVIAYKWVFGELTEYNYGRVVFEGENVREVIEGLKKKPKRYGITKRKGEFKYKIYDIKDPEKPIHLDEVCPV